MSTSPDSPFTDIPILDFPLATGADNGNPVLASVSSIATGIGAKSFHQDQQGIWLGSDLFASAPFRVSMSGALVATGATISGAITATSGVIGGFTIGATTITATNLILDSANQRITLGSANDILIADADDATYRLWIGNAVAASAPFSVTKAGGLSATGATIAGAITATSGSITGAFSVLSALTVGAAGSFGSGQTAYDTGIGFWMEYNGGTPRFSLGNSAGSKITFDGTTLTVPGAASIGGFTIGADYIKDAADSMGLASTVTGGDDVRFWAGATFANRATAQFRVTEGGAVTASDFAFTGGTVGSAVVVALGAINIASRGWTQTSVFSVVNATTVNWGAGTFTSANGDAYSIGAGSTSVMAAKTYIYLDIGVSTIAYQITTTASTAIGAGKVLIATAQNSTVEAIYQVLAGQGGQNIDAAQIVANSITANELSTSLVYAGSIEIDTAGNIRSGQTAYATGTGWFLGDSGGTSKLSIGNTTNYLTWDGTYLRIKGSFDVGSGGILNNSSYTVANLPVAPASVGFNVPSAYE